ncbi:MAG: iron ABC transporter permease [Anaerolineaceae bacterium]|nr:iron ABC transporter permease [Anaerolineaceae bacterium]
MKMCRTKWKDVSIWVLPLVFLIFFYFYPLGKIIGTILITDKALVVPSAVGWIIAEKAIYFTFYQAILSTLITMILGIPLALVFGRFDFRGKRWLRILATLPFILPTVVVAAGFNALIGPKGWLNILWMNVFHLPHPPINILNTLPAILLAHVFYNTSIVIRTVGTAWEQLNRDIENAAKVLGAYPIRVFLKITLPLLLPSILSASILVFLFDFTSFGVILMMGGANFTTIEVEIYIQTMQFLNLKMAAALSLIQLFFTMVFTRLSLFMTKNIHVPLIPATRGENVRKPETIFEKTFILFSILFLILLLVLPSAALILRSVFPIKNIKFAGTGFQGKFTLEYFIGLFQNRRNGLFFVPPIVGLRNSFIFAVSTTIIALRLGTMASVGSMRNRSSGRFFELLVMFPLGTSAVTLGLGYLSAFSVFPNAIRWFPLLIPMAHSIIALPFVIRIIKPAIDAIPRNLFDAAITLGVPRNQLWKKIALPLVKKQLATAAIYSFAISLGEFGATSFISRPEYPTLPIAIFRYLYLPGAENYGKAMAMASILLIICGSGFFLIEKLQVNEK